jgi:hypothetical protein
MTDEATQTPEAPQNGTVAPKASKTSWKNNRRHPVTLPSSTVVDLEIPNLPQLIKTGQIPNNLVDAALGAAQSQQGKAPTREQIGQQAEFNDHLVAITVKDPEIAADDVKDLPYEDVEMIVEIAMRQRDVDALYRQLGGLHKSEEWRTFRGVGLGAETMAGL